MKKLIFIFLVLCSCKKDPDITIQLLPDQVRNEVLDFISEGKQRGIDVDLKGLRIYLRGDLQNGWVGFYEHKTHSIYLDTNKLFHKYIQQKDQIIFHELGHAILKREHNNDTLPNGEIKSIMCEKKICDYYGLSFYKRQYYIDELFNENISYPYWAN